MQLIGITGGTGFIGRHLARSLTAAGNKVLIFTRNPAGYTPQKDVYYCYWDPERKRADIECFKQVNAMVHLAGEGIADKRWTEKRKAAILDSRLTSTAFLVDQLRRYSKHCKSLVCASAIGYYGPDKNQTPFTEADGPAGDFLGSTCVQWENASIPAAQFLMRTILRFGIILGKDGGAFPEFAKPQSFGVVPILGSGKQITSWIHIDDLVGMIQFALTNQLHDVYNAVAPRPTTHKELMQAIAKAKRGIKIPVPVPEAALKIILGEMSIEVLKSCTVSSDKIIQAGFSFKYTAIEQAVQDLVNTQPGQ